MQEMEKRNENGRMNSIGSHTGIYTISRLDFMV